MANIAHASLTGAELHEPKGADTASLGEVYVANGTGSGSWANVGTSSFTGMIADFTWPVVQTGWLELDGSNINTTTYSALYDVMTIQMTGTRTSGSAIITSLSSTANMRAGYYVFGTGIASGTTISSVDSASQITLSGNASSSGSSTVVVSPWLLNTGTIRLPDLSTAGRYRRSRTSSTIVGALQADQNKSHTHTGSGTTSSESADHTHTYSGTTGSESVSHTHGYAQAISNGWSNGVSGNVNVFSDDTANQTGGNSVTHTHDYSGTSSGRSAAHTHTYSFTTSTGSADGTEARPLSIVVMTCVKT